MTQPNTEEERLSSLKRSSRDRNESYIDLDRREILQVSEVYEQGRAGAQSGQAYHNSTNIDINTYFDTQIDFYFNMDIENTFTTQ